MNFGGQINGIKGISGRRRIPRLGKIRLGAKAKSAKGAEYPVELPFFFLPEEVARVLKPKADVERAKELGVRSQPILDFIAKNPGRFAEEIEIRLPLDDPAQVFPQSLKWYGGTKGLKCQGNGERAMRNTAEGMSEIQCPCENLRSKDNPRGECVPRAHLLCFIPSVSVGGVYQIDMGSINSITDINSGMMLTRELVGRIQLVPLKLRRIPTITHADEGKQTHFTLQLLCDVPANQLENLRRDTGMLLMGPRVALPQIEDSNPKMDTDGPVIDVEAGEPEAAVEPESIPAEETTGEPFGPEDEAPANADAAYQDAVTLFDMCKSLGQLKTAFNGWAAGPGKELPKAVQERVGKYAVAFKMGLLDGVGKKIVKAKTDAEAQTLKHEAYPFCKNDDEKAMLDRAMDARTV